MDAQMRMLKSWAESVSEFVQRLNLAYLVARSLALSTYRCVRSYLALFKINKSLLKLSSVVVERRFNDGTGPIRKLRRQLVVHPFPPTLTCNEPTLSQLP